MQQNSFTKYDKYCPFYKSVDMMRNIAAFHQLATAAIEKTAAGNAEGQKITYNVIKQRLSDVLYKLTSQKFEDPGMGTEVHDNVVCLWCQNLCSISNALLSMLVHSIVLCCCISNLDMAGGGKYL